MPHIRLLPAFALLLVGFVLSACVSSNTALLAGTQAAAPLPDAFVLANVEGKPDAGRFDRKGDSYIAVENGVKTTYRLVPLDGPPGTTGPFYIGVETNERGTGANYGLAEIAPAESTPREIVLHSFDKNEMAAELGNSIKTDDSGFEVSTDDQVLALFRRVAADALAGRTRMGHFRIYDLSIPDQRAEGERLLEESRKDSQAQ